MNFSLTYVEVFLAIISRVKRSKWSCEINRAATNFIFLIEIWLEEDGEEDGEEEEEKANIYAKMEEKL